MTNQPDSASLTSNSEPLIVSGVETAPIATLDSSSSTLSKELERGGDQGASPHFTYIKAKSESLEQGDVLEKTPEIQEMLKKVHPHYLKPDYSHFIVLSQSCDLFRRGGPCKSRYITLAAVRPFNLVLERELSKYQDEVAKVANVCAIEKQRLLTDFLSKVFHNNHPEFFYLHEDAVLKFPISSCAFLRLSIAVRSEEHYEKCLKARLFSLNDVFKAKLGWMVGNMYSRVGTDDWVPTVENQNEFNQRTKVILEGACQWIEEKKIAAVKKKVSAGELDKDPSKLRDAIRNVNLKSKKETVIDQVISALTSASLLNDEQQRTARFLLNNDPGLATLVK